ncbi:M23 family metallopeptidase [Arthrobacter agilis]|uniref:M23 family metallopeptidase n=1 Tax=Arthrobacter agilis TaxID=37921 RepID=UPI00277DCE5B|nr:M23 family metallopeptidase [Arthrobacter agilis]MDQ0736216.1 murein DD-endopeptidase MepM/ murein hydrolase activator NlpD [Arthrobacter agilis]
MTQTVIPGRRRASDEHPHQAVKHLPAHLPARRSLRAQPQRTSTDPGRPDIRPAEPSVHPAEQTVRPAEPSIRPAEPLTRRALREQERAVASVGGAVPAEIVPVEAVPAAAVPVPADTAPQRTQPTQGTAALPSRRSVRDTPAVAHQPSREGHAAGVRPPATRRTAIRTGNRPTPFTRLRDNAATAGIVLASAGLLMGAVAPSVTSTGTADAAGGTALASDAARAVTAPAGAIVDFGLESTGSADEGIAPAIATARALSSSLTPAAKQRKAFSVPVDNPVVASTFGYRVDPMGGFGSELHTGLDYASACGTPVEAADAGTVVDSGWHAYGGGQRIVIDHGDGLKTTYNHMSSLAVPAGTTVERGDLIGAVGSTGNSTGCHLHFEVMVNDDKVDPQPWL